MLIWCTYLKNSVIIKNGCCEFYNRCSCRKNKCYVIFLDENKKAEQQIEEIKSIIYGKQ